MKKRLALLGLICALCFGGALSASAAKNVVTAAKTVSGGTWVKSSSGKKYRYADGSYARSVWLNVGGSIYRINSQGLRMSGWFSVGGTKYYAGTNGKLYVKRWLTYKNHKYYFQSDANYARSKWVKIGGKYYYFLKSGKMAANRQVGKYYVGPDGVRVTDTDTPGEPEETEETDPEILAFDGNYIFVGDSRTVELKEYAPRADAAYIGGVNTGYPWLKSTAGPLLQRYLKKKPNVKVVLAFGVNDPDYIDDYIAYYRELMAAYPQTKFYVLSANPVDEEKQKEYGGWITNRLILSFNKKLKAAFKKPTFVASFSYMKKNGFETRDGIHYEPATYQMLDSFIISKIG